MTIKDKDCTLADIAEVLQGIDGDCKAYIRKSKKFATSIFSAT